MSDDDTDTDTDSDDPNDGVPGGLTRDETLVRAREFLDEFRDQDVYAVTVRQMYYRFVASGTLQKPAGLVGEDAKKWWNRQYKRIGNVLSEARYSDRFPLDGIRDGGRHVREGDFTRTVDPHEIAGFEAEALTIREAIPSFLIRRARWHGQNVHLSVWVEKEGMEGIFSDVCSPAGVDLLACKGYPSVSALYSWLKGAYFAVHGEHPDRDHAQNEVRSYTYSKGFDWTEYHRGTASQAVILYFGDHDPDGWEIPRAAERGLHRLMDNYGLHIPLLFRRLALNMNQIITFAPPPFEAPMSSARFAGYRREHQTDKAWELDALDPVQLRSLIRAGIAQHWDQSIADANDVEIGDYRRRLAVLLGMDPDDIDDDDSDGGLFGDGDDSDDARELADLLPPIPDDPFGVLGDGDGDGDDDDE